VVDHYPSKKKDGRVILYQALKANLMRSGTLAFISILMAVGCSTSETIVSFWKADNVRPREYNKIMVLAIINETNPPIRDRMETHFAGDLRDIGYNAITSVSVFGTGIFSSQAADSVINSIRNSGADAVITIVLRDIYKKQQDAPAYDNLASYYSAMNTKVSGTGYFIKDTKYFWETNFYDVATKQLLYSVQLKPYVPSRPEVIDPHGYGKLIVADMVNKKVL
jgi:hypothetical protein